MVLDRCLAQSAEVSVCHEAWWIQKSQTSGSVPELPKSEVPFIKDITVKTGHDCCCRRQGLERWE